MKRLFFVLFFLCGWAVNAQQSITTSINANLVNQGSKNVTVSKLVNTLNDLVSWAGTTSPKVYTITQVRSLTQNHPSVVYVSDANAFYYLDASDVVSSDDGDFVLVAGSLRYKKVRLNSIYGKDGSGLNSPGANLLYYAGRGTGSAYGGNHIWYSSFYSISNSTLRPYAEIMRLTPQGYLGIGRTPVYPLDVSGEIRGTNLIASANTTQWAICFFNSSGLLGSHANFTYNSLNSSLNVTGDGNFTGYIGHASMASTPSAPSSGFRLYANNTGLFSWIGANGFTRTFDSGSNTANRTYTLPNASGTVPLLESTQSFTGTNTFTGNTYLATSSGNVGIGTSSPAQKLHVNGSTQFDNVVYLGSHGFWTWNGSAANTMNLVAASSKAISFGANATYDQLYISTLGNIGFGTTNPLSTSDVNGSQGATYLSINSNTTLGNQRFIVATASCVITLPSASTVTRRVYTINARSTGITISSYNDLSGSAQTTITNGTSITIISDGTSWQRVQ